MNLNHISIIFEKRFIMSNFKIIPVKKLILILPVLEIQIEKYFKPSQIQMEIIGDLSATMDDSDKQRAYQIIDCCKTEILDVFRHSNAVLIDVEWDTNVDNNCVLNNNAIESSFGILDYTSRRRLNLKFLLKEGLILASKNQLFKWFDNKSDTDQQLLMDRIRKERDRYASICTENENFEEQVKQARLEEARLLQEERIMAENRKKERLLGLLGNLIPNSAEDYGHSCQNYLTRNPVSSEFEFLKLLLQYFKIHCQAKKLPASFFTVTTRGQRLSIDMLKEKLLKILQ